MVTNNVHEDYETGRASLFADWKRLHESFLYDGKTYAIDHVDGLFIEDGVICPERWFSGEIRPLFLLKEAYNERKDPAFRDLVRDHLLGDVSASLMWRRVATWTQGLLTTTPDRIAPYGRPGDMPPGQVGEYLRRCAVVNVKKSSGKKRSDLDEIYAYAAFDQARLLAQLELCDPTIIVCGYTGRALEVILNLKEPLRQPYNEELFYHTTLNGHPLLVLDYWHPANQYPNALNYFGLMGIYHRALNQR